MPHDSDQPGPAQESDELSRLREEFARQRKINAVLMDRVERSDEAAGSSLGLFHLASELSQQVMKQQELLRDEAKRADWANRAKSEFLANMSHEIRTPMTAILGYADLLADPSLSDKERATHIATIKRNGDHLLTLINDILDLSKIETGKMTVERVETSPVQIIEEVASLMRVRAHAQGLELNLHYETPIPKSILSDPIRLRQILTNLVGNAIKFTSIGHVTIRTRFLREVDGQLQIEIEDSGIGMTEEQLGRVFESFTQGDASMARKFGGSGLGLKISRSLAELMGWTLTADSVLNEGSRFTLCGKIANDADMPMIGADERSRVSEAICSGTAKGEVKSDNAASRTPVLVGATILLAEDGPDNQRLIDFHLRRAGAMVVLVENGAMAVDRISAQLNQPLDSSHDSSIDLVLMDMQMPVKDGYAATSELRSLGCTLPIIALTAHAMEGDRQKCLDAGCDDYLTKPIDRDRLVNCCACWMTPAPDRSAKAPAEIPSGRVQAAMTGDGSAENGDAAL